MLKKKGDSSQAEVDEILNRIFAEQISKPIEKKPGKKKVVKKSAKKVVKKSAKKFPAKKAPNNRK